MTPAEKQAVERVLWTANMATWRRAAREGRVWRLPPGMRAKARHEREAMAQAGYRQHETDWEINRGFAVGQIILDAKVSVDGKSVWTKVGYPPGTMLTSHQDHLFRLVQAYGTAHPTADQMRDKVF
jgi:hypothetical protein